MAVYSNLELNSFLTNLMDKWDERAAVAVISTFHKLPLAQNRVVTKKEVSEDASMTGHTNEVGNVTVQNEDIKETIVGERDEEVARVGHYKIKRIAINNGQSFGIMWHHFWASDIMTMNLDKGPSPFFIVEYIEDQLRPIALLRFDFVPHGGTTLLTLGNWLVYLKVFVLNFFKYGKISKVYTKKWVAYPTVIFGQSKLKAAR